MTHDQAPQPRRAAPAPAAREFARAKVNLTLEVGGLDDGGLHAVASLMVALEWGDRVRVRLGRGREGVRLTLRGRGAPRNARNLAVRAAAAWARRDPGLPPVAIELVKRLPAGAGLGGGSSDAGAVLRALARLRPGVLEPAELAPELGSDVAFFAQDLAAARASGRGERLAKAPTLPPAWRLILVVPPFRLPTAAVFGRLDRLRGASAPPRPGAATDRLCERLAALAAGGGDRAGEQALMEMDALVCNDLWPAAVSLRPALADLRERLRRAVGGRPVVMTGSGSVLVGLVEDAGRAELAARRLRADGLRAVVVRSRPPSPEDP